MSIEVDRATLPCAVCGAHVSELRRGRCWGCYSKWVELRPVGKGATCSVCNERRRDHLRLVEVHSRSLPFCHGCAARVTRLMPVPYSVEGLRAALRRDRRDLDRRGDSLDQRIFPRERRDSDRRGAPREMTLAETEPALLLAASVDDLVLEITDRDLEFSDVTVVSDIPRRPAGDE